MQVIITTRHVELSDSLKAHTEERVAKIAHFSEKLGDIAVVLSSERHVFQAELRTRTDGQDLVSHAEAEDMRTAIDAAATKLERQVKDHRARAQQHKAKPVIEELPGAVEPPA